MNKLRKRFWGCVVGAGLAMGSLLYGIWSVRVFKVSMSSFFSKFKDLPFYHPWPVWTKLGKAYAHATGNWNPMEGAHFLSRCMWTMIYGGILLFVLFTVLAIVEFVRHTKI